MNDEIENNNLSNFKEYLIKNGYSEHVIPMYIRKVKEFLVYNNGFSIIGMDYEKIKKTISEYMANISLSSQKDMIQAALHTYYYFISVNQFTRRLYSKDFIIDMFIESEIERFRKYLSNVARLSSNTIICQCNSVKTFLYCSFPERDFSPGKVIADHVRIYFTHTLSHVSATSKKTIIVRIRSYLRFLEFTDGFQSEEILKLPMTSPVWKRAGIPKYLTDTEIDHLFSTYNRTNSTGIRNYAIARCLKDLGLRCSEVARLSLDDFDWRQGTIAIKKTKSHSKRILPLHEITGKSIEAYLVNSRPITSERILFVRFKNKQGYPMGTSQVRNTVRIAATKAGLDNFTGTHMLRHTAAKEMINSGVDLKTIADVLGHESIETICVLIKTSAGLYSPDGLRARTIPTAIGLLWSTGMRPSEACNLMDDDVDLNNGLITIRETKFSKSRILPLHETTVSELRYYIDDRNRLRKDFLDQHFLIITGSRRLELRNFEYALKVTRDKVLTNTKEWNRRPPRLYDIRHSFACNTLLSWLKNGVNVNNKILYLSTYLGHVKLADTYWYLTGTPELMQFATENFEKFFYENGAVAMKNNDFPNLLQRFFMERLMKQQKVSPCTIQSYKDTFRILLKYMHAEYGTRADSVTMEEINANSIIEFLNYLEDSRKNKCKTVNNRLAAIKSFMEYVSYECPEYLGIVRKVKAIPFRNADKKDICYLCRDEIDFLLNACEITTPNGKRDYLMILLLYNSGMRVSEMISIQGKDVTISGNGQCHLRIMGKGRKERTVPLWRTTTKYLIEYMHENLIQSCDYLLSGRNVEHLTRSGVRYRIDCVVKKASINCHELENKSVTPHVFRHSTAMSLLQAGIDISTIAIWLGHESVETTHKYMVADINLKENALKKLHEPESIHLESRYHATDDIIQFLNSL